MAYPDCPCATCLQALALIVTLSTAVAEPLEVYRDATHLDGRPRDDDGPERDAPGPRGPIAPRSQVGATGPTGSTGPSGAAPSVPRGPTGPTGPAA
jgi:hypothetical protein